MLRRELAGQEGWLLCSAARRVVAENGKRCGTCCADDGLLPAVAQGGVEKGKGGRWGKARLAGSGFVETKLTTIVVRVLCDTVKRGVMEQRAAMRVILGGIADGATDHLLLVDALAEPAAEPGRRLADRVALDGQRRGDQVGMGRVLLQREERHLESSHESRLVVVVRRSIAAGTEYLRVSAAAARRRLTNGRVQGALAAAGVLDDRAGGRPAGVASASVGGSGGSGELGHPVQVLQSRRRVRQSPAARTMAARRETGRERARAMRHHAAEARGGGRRAGRLVEARGQGRWWTSGTSPFVPACAGFSWMPERSVWA